ncbi:MAG TPA: hypothetical protein VMU25_02340 [Candidatus Paceibacterota bacterium]|nr:hypothetical protein [Candidatus Paceibacterota bacterium]
MSSENTAVSDKLQQRFQTLPKAVQDAIQSADVEKRMRALAETQKLHIDQWQALDNEVLLTLLGFQRVENLQENIQKEVGVDSTTAATLTENISKIVFEPIREELERYLSHPDAKAKEVSDVEAARTAALASENGSPVVTPKAVRTSAVSESYKAGNASSQRKDVHNDPYRESPL